MSPEIGKFKKYDFKTDIWSLGILLYEMVHGHLPFKCDGKLATLINKINEGMKISSNLT